MKNQIWWNEWKRLNPHNNKERPKWNINCITEVCAHKTAIPPLYRSETNCNFRWKHFRNSLKIKMLHGYRTLNAARNGSLKSRQNSMRWNHSPRFTLTNHLLKWTLLSDQNETRSELVFLSKALLMYIKSCPYEASIWVSELRKIHRAMNLKIFYGFVHKIYVISLAIFTLNLLSKFSCSSITYKRVGRNRN